MIKGKKNRKAFVEEISGLQNIVSNFSSSDQHYTNVMNRLVDYSQSNEKEKVRLLLRVLSAFPQVKRGVKRQDYRSFLLDFETQVSKLGLTDDFLNEELTEKEQKIIILYRDENILKKSRIIEFLNSDIVEPSQHSSLGKSKMITDLLQRLKTSYDPSSDTLLGTDLKWGSIRSFVLKELYDLGAVHFLPVGDRCVQNIFGQFLIDLFYQCFLHI